jgi:hypothetical protein
MRIKKLFIILLFIVGLPIHLYSQSLQEMFRKPGVIGDSLSQGFYGVIVEKKTQDWAYPVLVVKQANSNVYYNELKGPYVNLEDVLKGNCGVFCIASSIIGGNQTTYSLPTHAGITGASYTTVLKTSGKCEDITATKWVKEWYWKNWYTYTYRWVQVPDCQKPDKFHQFGLRDAGTQMQIMEKIKPSFVFASVGANHVLCTALHTSLDCLDEARFKRDFNEVMLRLSRIGTVRGGVIFTVPNVTAIAYLEEYRDPQGRSNYSGLKPFYRTSVSNPNQVLDNNEVQQIRQFLTMLNNELRSKAAAYNYALTDLELIFDDARENGRPIRHSSGWSPGNAGTNWPLPGKPGVFSLDGVHPNRYGHAVMANELIKSINQKYGYNIPLIDEYAAWYYDTLNRNPIDLKRFLTENIIGQAISWIINIFT